MKLGTETILAAVDDCACRGCYRKPSSQQRREAAGVTRYQIAMQGQDMLARRATDGLELWRWAPSVPDVLVRMRREELRLRPFRRDS